MMIIIIILYCDCAVIALNVRHLHPARFFALTLQFPHCFKSYSISIKKKVPRIHGSGVGSWPSDRTVPMNQGRVREKGRRKQAYAERVSRGKRTGVGPTWIIHWLCGRAEKKRKRKKRKKKKVAPNRRCLSTVDPRYRREERRCQLNTTTTIPVK